MEFPSTHPVFSSAGAWAPAPANGQKAVCDAVPSENGVLGFAVIGLRRECF